MTRDTPDPEPGETSPGLIPMHRLMASYRFDDGLARVLTAFQYAGILPGVGVSAVHPRRSHRRHSVRRKPASGHAWLSSRLSRPNTPPGSCRPDSYSLCITIRMFMKQFDNLTLHKSLFIITNLIDPTVEIIGTTVPAVLSPDIGRPVTSVRNFLNTDCFAPDTSTVEIPAEVPPVKYHRDVVISLCPIRKPETR